MADRSVTVTLRAQIDAFRSAMRAASKEARGVGDESERTGVRTDSAMKRMAASARTNADAWTTAGTAVAAVGAAAAVGVGVAVKKFMDFDQAMSSVAAATHASADSLSALRKAALQAGADTQYTASQAAGAIENLAKAGVSTSDILGGALTGSLNLAAAGQIDVGDAAEIAATAMTQFGLRGNQVTHVADLLAAGAGKAQGEVGDLSYALKQSGLVASQMGLSIEETTGTLAAFASAGLLGSDAGTAFRTMLLRLANPSNEAATAMEELGISAYDAQGNFMGMSSLAGQLQKALAPLPQAQRDAALATIFGSDAIRAANVLYAQGAKGITEWTAKVNDQGYAAETARLKTDNLRGDIERLGGALDTALIKTGEGANGALRTLTQSLTHVIDAYSELPGPVQQGTLAIGGLVAAVGLVGGGILVTVPKVVQLYDAFGQLGSAGAKAQGAMRGMAAALPTIGALSAVAVGFVAVGAAAAQISNRSRDAVPGIEATTAALLDMNDAGNTVALNRLFAEGIDFQYFDDGKEKAYGLSEAFKTLTQKSWDDKINDSIGSFFGEVRASDQAADVFENIGQSLARMVQSGDAETAQKQFNAMAKELGLTGDQTKILMDMMPAYGESLNAVSNESRTAGDASGEGGLAGGLAAAEQAGKEASDAIQKLIDKLTVLQTGALDATRANIGLEDAINKAKESAKSHTATLDLNTEAGRENTGAILDVADALNEKVKADFQNTASTKGVTAAADELTRNMPLLRQRFIDTMIQMGYNRQTAEQLATQYLRTPNDIQTDVRLIGDQYARSQIQGLGGDIQHLQSKGVQVEVALGPGAKKMATFMRLPVAKGAVIDYFANGAENHVAQIAPAGAWRVWAEPETGGEAYIPLAPQKRQRSMQIWQETGKRLGVQGFASGGINRNITADLDADSDIVSTRAGVQGMQNWIDAFGKKIGSEMTDKLQPAASGGPGMGWQAQWNAVHAAFPWAQLTSSYRPGAITATGNASYHGKGRAIDVSPSMAIFDWIRANFPNSTELIYSPAGMRQLWHGQPHMYTGVTRAMHFNHVHWAMRNGGILNPHIRDAGGPLLPGWTYNGTPRAEYVVPANSSAAAASATPEISVFVQAVPDGPWVQQQAKIVVDGAFRATARNYRGA